VPGQAQAQHAAALNLASRSGDRYEQARALGGLARSYQAAGDLDQARDHWRRALARYTDLGLPEADDSRTELTALGSAEFPGLGRVGPAIPADLRVRTG
jgi:tetratricopeptide (TPR) repeat protein